MSRPLPRQAAPALTVPTLDGSLWSLDTCPIKTFLMVVFYRHKNCGVCQSYLKELVTRHDAFGALGVDVIAISTDDAKGAQSMADEFSRLPFQIGYDLPFNTATEWGLYLSGARKDTEPKLFSEPGLFLIDSNRMLYYASVQSMPFGRTELRSLLEWIPKLVDQSIPARGEFQQGTD